MRGNETTNDWEWAEAHARKVCGIECPLCITDPRIPASSETTPAPEVEMSEYDRYLLARIEVARQHCYDINAGRKKWRMSVPAQDDDSDILLDDVLDACAKRITELLAAEEQSK